MKTLCILSFFWCALASGQTLTTINGTDPLSGAPAVINANLLALKLAKMSIPSTYAGGTTYAAGDTVISAGATYASLQSSNTGNTPGSAPTFWMLIAGAGGTGPQGPAGATGATGPQGPQGVPGSGASAATTTALGSVIVPTSGSLSIDGAGNLTITQAALLAKMGAASSTQPGYLLAADWATFNGKQAALGFTPQNSTVPNTNNAGIGNCPAGQYETGNVTGTTPQCAQVQAAQVTGTFPFAQLPIGTTANTVPAGNDSRIVNAVQTSSIGVANGIPSLDGTGKVSASQLPAGTAPATVKYASQLTGASLDVDVTTGLKIGGGSATDNLAAANAFLATASASNPIIFYIDGPMGIRGALDVTKIPNTTVRCIGGGSIYNLAGSNSNTVQNGFFLPFDQAASAPSRAGYLRLEGCRSYGNRGTYPNGNSSLASNGSIDAASGNSVARERGGLGGYAVGTLASALTNSATSFTLSTSLPIGIPLPLLVVIDTEIISVTAYSGANVTGATRGLTTVPGFNLAGASAAASHLSGATIGSFQWYCGLNFANLSSLYVDGWTVIDAPAYGMRFNNVGPAYITHSEVFFSLGVNQAPNTDGIHIDGPANDIHIDNSTLTNTGDDAIAFNIDEGYGGASSRLQVNNVTCNRCAVGARVYGNSSIASQVSFNNFSGTFRDEYLIIGNYGTSSPISDSVASVQVSNGSVTAQPGAAMAHIVQLGTNVGTLQLSNMVWIAPNASSTAWFTPSATTQVSDLSLINSRVYQNTTASGTPAVLTTGSSSFKKVTLSGYSVNQQFGQSFGSTPCLIDNNGGGSIASVQVIGLDSTNITAFPCLSTWAGIGQIYGTGLTETGFQIPDAKVLKNGQYYVSKEQAVPVVKFGTSSFPTSAALTLGDTGAHFAMQNSAGVGTQARLQSTANTFTEVGTGSFTVLGLVNASTLGAATQKFVSSMDEANYAPTTSYWLGYANSVNAFQFVTADTAHTFSVVNGAVTPTANTWYCVAGVHDASTPSARLNKLFVNSAQDSTSVTAGALSVYNGGQPLGVGGSNTSGSGYSAVTGRTSMVLKVSAALTPTQITYLCNGTFGRTPAEVNAYLTAPAVDFLYEFYNAGALGTDSSTHATTLTAVGTITQAAGPR